MFPFVNSRKSILRTTPRSIHEPEHRGFTQATNVPKKREFKAF